MTCLLVPSTQLCIDRNVTVEYRPTTHLTGKRPTEFQVDGSEDFTDLSQTYLYLKVKIVNADGKPLAESDVVAPVNLFLHSLFSKVEIKLNGHQVSSMNNYVYPYRALLETLLSCGKEAKISHLESELYYKDTAGAIEEMSADCRNDGFLDRYQYCKDSKNIEMMGRLHHDMFQQDKLLLNKVDMNIVLS